MRLGLVLVAVGLALTLIGLVVVNGGVLDAGSTDASSWRLVFYAGPVLMAIGGVRVMAEARRRGM
jgi:hypothetical protein